MILSSPAGMHLLRWASSAPDVQVLLPGRVSVAVEGLWIDQPTKAEWFVEVEPDSVYLGTKWLAQARIVLRHAQGLHLDSGGESKQIEVAIGPAVVTIATRDLEVTDLLEGREVSHRGDTSEHDVRIHVQALPGQGVSAEEPRADEQGPGTTSVLSGLLLDGDATPLIRTDFSNDAAWARIITAISRPVDLNDPHAITHGEADYSPLVAPVDDRRLAGITGAALGEFLATKGQFGGYALLADARSVAETTAGVELTVEYVDLSVATGRDEELFESFMGRTFRCRVAEIASIEANLSIANMDFNDFAANTDPDGVFRGFPSP